MPNECFCHYSKYNGKHHQHPFSVMTARKNKSMPKFSVLLVSSALLTGSFYCYYADSPSPHSNKAIFSLMLNKFCPKLSRISLKRQLQYTQFFNLIILCNIFMHIQSDVHTHHLALQKNAFSSNVFSFLMLKVGSTRLSTYLLPDIQ